MEIKPKSTSTLKRGEKGPKGGTIYDIQMTLYNPYRGWVTYWSELSEKGGIMKRMYERYATDEEVFVAQMLD